MFKLGFRFIGVVKTAHRGYPLQYLGSLQLAERGSMAAVVSEHDDVYLTAFVWCDRERRYFISTADGIALGQSYQRKRMRQVQPVESNLPPEVVDLEVVQPKGAEVYYSTCAAIDQHNRWHQDDLQLERKLRTPRWDMRVGMSLFGMMIVDTYRVHKLCTRSTLTPSEFYTKLGEALIENPYIGGHGGGLGAVTRRLSSDSSTASSLSSKTNTSGIGLHLTPVKEHVTYEGSDGSQRKRLRQVSCSFCYRKTTRVCSECLQDSLVPDRKCGFCDPVNNRYCYRQHMEVCHGVGNPSSDS